MPKLQPPPPSEERSPPEGLPVSCLILVRAQYDLNTSVPPRPTRRPQPHAPQPINGVDFEAYLERLTADEIEVVNEGKCWVR